ncbi:MAG: ribosome recycling factor [Candidatus Hydrogenedentota bacterium]|nr:MAG: ribosome recycling factor [Candidatus Hydrogenedentota bacterium]
MIKDILEDAKARMEGAISALKKDLAAFRTGRASTALLDGVLVEYYGSRLPVNQVATLSTPEARLIVIQPWDKNAIEPIEKAISAANLGVTPQNDGSVIRLALPPLTEERRKELVKQVKKKGEDAKIAIRNVRRDARELLEGLQKEGEASEDEVKRAQEELQRITNSFTETVDQIGKGKEEEILNF